MKHRENRDVDGEERFGVVVRKFSECGSLFRRACGDKDHGLAQEAAIAGLWVISRLFPANDADAHDLLLSMIGMIVVSKWGRTEHVLLEPVSPIEGTRKGLGHAYLAAFSITASRILVDQGYSKRASRRVVAQLLAEQGCSLRKGAHGKPLPISEAAVRNWCESDVQLHQEIAADLMLIHSQALKRRGIGERHAILSYLREQAATALRESAMMGAPPIKRVC